MWIVKVLDIVDFDIESNEVHLFNNEENARECFRKIVQQERECAEREDYIIDTDEDNFFEMWQEYSRIENYGCVSIEEIKAED